MIPHWVREIFRKWPCADYCLQCGYFVLTPSEHCYGLYSDHIVVRQVKGTEYGHS